MHFQITAAALFVLFFAASADAADLSSWTVELQLNEDRSVNWKVTFVYDDFVTRDDYWVLAKISEFSVLADGKPEKCRIAPQEVGTSIICDELKAKTIIFNIKAQEQIGTFNSYNLFTYAFPITRFTDKFTLVITIPFGSALVSAEQLWGTGLSPFSPAFGKQGTDGRKIFVTWELQNPPLGETINARLIFEPVIGPIGDVAILIIIIGAAVIGLLFYLHHHRSRVKHVLPILTASERAVMQIVMREKSVDQRSIVKETDFSKAKVSRIVKGLEERGVVRTKPKGRTKLVMLSDGGRREEKKEEKPEKETSEQKKEERQKRIIEKLLGKE